MKREINLDTWVRKEHYAFFSRFEEPFFGVTVNVDGTQAYREAKESGQSFFLLYLYRALKAANRIEPFRYRIADQKVWVYDKVGASPTINRPDGTFGFAYMDFYEDEAQFYTAASEETERVRSSNGLMPAVSSENVIHFSALPWFSFTAVSHARCFSFPDSCPKIAFGKLEEQQGKQIMPVSVHVHHALMDGHHVAQFIETFQQLLNGASL